MFELSKVFKSFAIFLICVDNTPCTISTCFYIFIKFFLSYPLVKNTIIQADLNPDWIHLNNCAVN